MRFILNLSLLLLSLMVYQIQCTNLEIPITGSSAKSWYKDGTEPDRFKPSNVYDKDYTTTYSVKDQYTDGNFLNLYFSEINAIYEVKITNRLEGGCCTNRIDGTAVFVYVKEDGDNEKEVKRCGDIPEMSEGSSTDKDAQTYNIDCQGALGNMVKITDEVTGGGVGHGLSEVKVFGYSNYCEQSRCTVKRGDELKVNEGLTSPNGIITFGVRTDGNLILKCKNKKIWSTEMTDGDAVDPFLLIQSNGNIAVYNSDVLIWKSEAEWTEAQWTEAERTRLEVTNTGNVVLIGLPGGTVLWESGTFCPTLCQRNYLLKIGIP